MSSPAILIFCYKRVNLLKSLISSIKKNQISINDQFYFFCDGPKNNTETKLTKEVHKYINAVSGIKKKIIIRKKNIGLKANILDGINFAFRKHDSIIVLEDDLVLAKNFIKTFKLLILKYKNNPKILSISGYNFNQKKEVNFLRKDFFLSKRPSSWGWATWKKKWHYNRYKKKTYTNVENIIDYGNDLYLMNEKKRINFLNSWAFDWTLKHILYNKFSIYPRYTLVNNLGNDEAATNNFFKTDRFYSKIFNHKISNFEYQCECPQIKKFIKRNYDQKYFYFIAKLFVFRIIYFFKF